MIPDPVLVTTAAEMREIDRRSIEEHGIPGHVLMERAGAGAVDVLLERFRPALRKGVVIVAGKGNNGGDGLVMARLLRRRKIPVEIYIAGRADDFRGDAARNFRRLGPGKRLVREIDRVGLPVLAAAAGKAGVLVDALFGTGLRGPLDERSRAIVETMNAAPCAILAVDVPSGLDADRGVALGAAVQATVTVTFTFPKPGLLVYPGADFAGDVAVVDIGIAPEAVAAVRPQQHLLSVRRIAALLPPRERDAHKGTYGHVLVIAGSRGKAGAAVLAARAALRAGSGLVTLAGPSASVPGLVAAAPEVMTEPLRDDDGRWSFDPLAAEPLVRALEGKDAVVFGPGIGQSAATRELTRWLVADCRAPLVIDADGLNCLAGSLGWLADRPAPTVLTPHPGEMARLVDRPTAEVQEDRLTVARHLATEHRVTVILKGARTLVASPDGDVAINPTGNPGMASGGMGDALAGMCGALLGQGLTAPEAAAAGVFWHGFAADSVAARLGDAGFLATDVIEELPLARRRLQDTLFR